MQINFNVAFEDNEPASSIPDIATYIGQQVTDQIHSLEQQLSNLNFVFVNEVVPDIADQLLEFETQMRKITPRSTVLLTVYLEHQCLIGGLEHAHFKITASVSISDTLQSVQNKVIQVLAEKIFHTQESRLGLYWRKTVVFMPQDPTSND
jgi:hypothetical protein